jgi:hypothetical protein
MDTGIGSTRQYIVDGSSNSVSGSVHVHRIARFVPLGTASAAGKIFARFVSAPRMCEFSEELRIPAGRCWSPWQVLSLAQFLHRPPVAQTSA